MQLANVCTEGKRAFATEPLRPQRRCLNELGISMDEDGYEHWDSGFAELPITLRRRVRAVQLRASSER